MENYETLIIELLPNELTPKAKYKYLQHLIAIKDLHTKAKIQSEFDLSWYGCAMAQYRMAERNLNILEGKEEPCEEALYKKSL